MPLRGLLLPEVAAQIPAHHRRRLLTPGRRGRTRAVPAHHRLSNPGCRPRPAPAASSSTTPSPPHCSSPPPANCCPPSAAPPPPSSSPHAPTTSSTAPAGRTVEGCDEPVGIAAAQHAGCAGVVQRVLIERQRPDPVARHRRAGLQPPATPRDRPPRRRLPHPRLRRPRRLVRNPPCPRTRQRRQDPHRQRRHALLVPSPIPRPARLGDPDEPRRPRSPRTHNGSTPPDNGEPSPNPNHDYTTSSKPSTDPTSPI